MSVGAWKIDDLRVGGGDRRCGTGHFDALASHPHNPPIVHRLAVKDACGLDQCDRRGIRAWTVLRWQSKGTSAEHLRGGEGGRIASACAELEGRSLLQPIGPGPDGLYSQRVVNSDLNQRPF